jgi:hypothetical protein
MRWDGMLARSARNMSIAEVRSIIQMTRGGSREALPENSGGRKVFYI